MTEYKYYAIINKKTKKLLTGTNFNKDGTPIQLYADEYRVPLLLAEGEVKFQVARRKIDLNEFEIVRARVIIWKDEEKENEISV